MPRGTFTFDAGRMARGLNMTNTEVRNRLAAISKYNAYFATERDKDGNPLTQHIVGDRLLWRIMTREWNVDPTRFGISEPPELPKFRAPVSATQPQEFDNGL